MEALLDAWRKWEPMKLRTLKLEYLDGKQSDWGAMRIGRLLLQKPA